MKKLFIAIIVVAIVAGGAYAYVSRQGAAGASSPPPRTETLPAVKAGDKVVAEAKVVPVQGVELGLPVAGTVAEVLAVPGDRVAAGQLLLRLDARQQRTAIAQAEAALARAQAGRERARASVALLKAGPREEDIATARAALGIAEAELARLRQGPDQAQLVAAQTNLAKAERARQQAQQQYDQVAFAPNIVVRPETLKLEQATQDYEAAKAQYEQLKAGPRQADVDVAQAQVEQARASLTLAQTGARAEAIAAAEFDVAAAGADVLAAEAGLAKAQDALADTELRAPFAGTIASFDAKAGELVAPTAIVARLADPSAWQVETQDLTELNVVRLKKGSPVSITFDALPGLSLPGTVSRIAEFGKTRQGDIVYTVIVKPDRQDDRLRWNMTASVSIEAK
ncbi:MAG: HlyD family efflux transporter periplasmic adaptor subunit [Chloroflexi bacterium]|nr:HlyD family efflux transporter periplasmic adaptor subunit [Chloroflexota bacterium]